MGVSTPTKTSRDSHTPSNKQKPNFLKFFHKSNSQTTRLSYTIPLFVSLLFTVADIVANLFGKEMPLALYGFRILGTFIDYFAPTLIASAYVIKAQQTWYFDQTRPFEEPASYDTRKMESLSLCLSWCLVTYAVYIGMHKPLTWQMLFPLSGIVALVLVLLHGLDFDALLPREGRRSKYNISA